MNRAALQKGHSIIQGKVYAYNSATGRTYRSKFGAVWLYPVTPYFEAWHALRESSLSPKAAANPPVYMNPEAIKIRLEATINDKGEYAFQNLRPGKYFLQTYMNFDMTTTESVYDGYDVLGTTPQGPVIQDVYHTEQRAWKMRTTMEAFATVERDGDMVFDLAPEKRIPCGEVI